MVSFIHEWWLNSQTRTLLHLSFIRAIKHFKSFKLLKFASWLIVHMDNRTWGRDLHWALVMDGNDWLETQMQKHFFQDFELNSRPHPPTPTISKSKVLQKLSKISWTNYMLRNMPYKHWIVFSLASLVLVHSSKKKMQGLIWLGCGVIDEGEGS